MPMVTEERLLVLTLRSPVYCPALGQSLSCLPNGASQEALFLSIQFTAGPATGSSFDTVSLTVDGQCCAEVSTSLASCSDRGPSILVDNFQACTPAFLWHC